MGHFTFKDEDFISRNKLITSIGANQANILPDGTKKAVKTSGAIDTEPQRSMTTYTYSEIMQGTAAHKPLDVGKDIFQKTLTTDLQGVLGREGGTTALLGGRAAFAEPDFRGIKSSGTQDAVQGALTGNVSGSDSTAGTGPRIEDSPNGKITIVNVQGIEVDQKISGQVDAMLIAAKADGVTLTGGGFRSHAQQIQTRINNCNGNIWDKGAKCSPPTAVPGKSRHEMGLAIDFDNMSRGTKAFDWLVANAARYGFQNLPSEAWHWSTDGH